MIIIELVVLALINILIFTFILEKCIHEIITLLVYEFCMSLICLLDFVFWKEEDVWGIRACYYCKDLVFALVFGEG